MERRSFLGALTALPFLRKLPLRVVLPAPAPVANGLRGLVDDGTMDTTIHGVARIATVDTATLAASLKEAYPATLKLFERDDTFYRAMVAKESDE